MGRKKRKAENVEQALSLSVIGGDSVPDVIRKLKELETASKSITALTQFLLSEVARLSKGNSFIDKSFKPKNLIPFRKERGKLSSAFIAFADKNITPTAGNPQAWLCTELMDSYIATLSVPEKICVNKTNFGMQVQRYCKAMSYLQFFDRLGHNRSLRYIFFVSADIKISTSE